MAEEKDPIKAFMEEDGADEPVVSEPTKLPNVKPKAKDEDELDMGLPEEKPKKKSRKKKEDAASEASPAAPAAESNGPAIYALRTTANREDQVMDFLESNISRKNLNIYSVIRPHGMRGYIFVEAGSKADAENAAHGIPYARGILPKAVEYKELEHMVEPVKRELSIKKNDIVEIISGPFKRETAKITRIDEQKEEVVVELVEAAVPIPITLKIDAVKVIRRETDDDKSAE
jgi:transcriptional antiterminator NusG